MKHPRDDFSMTGVLLVVTCLTLAFWFSLLSAMVDGATPDPLANYAKQQRPDRSSGAQERMDQLFLKAQREPTLAPTLAIAEKTRPIQSIAKFPDPPQTGHKCYTCHANVTPIR